MKRNALDPCAADSPLDESWSTTGNAVSPERDPEGRKHLVQSSVGVPSRRHLETSGNFRHATAVLEPKPYEQSVCRVKRGERRLQERVHLIGAKRVLHIEPAIVHQGVEVYCSADQIHEATARCEVIACMCAITVVTMAPIDVTLMVPAQPLRHYKKPSGEFAAPIGNEPAQPPEIVSAELLDDVCVVIHRPVGVVPHGARNMKNQAAIALQELRPVGVSRRRVFGVK